MNSKFSSFLGLLLILMLPACSFFDINEKRSSFEDISKEQAFEDSLWIYNSRGRYHGVLGLLRNHFRNAARLNNIQYPVYHFSFDSILNKSGQSALPYDITNNLKHRLYQLRNHWLKISDISIDTLKRDVFVMRNVEQLLQPSPPHPNQTDTLKSVTAPDMIIVGAITAADEEFLSGSVRKRGDLDVGKGSGQSDSVYNAKGKESYSKFVINLQAQSIPGRVPLSSVEMIVMLKKDESNNGLSITVMGNGLGYTNEFYRSSGTHSSILSLLDIAVFELIRKLYRVPPLVSDREAVLAYYSDDFEMQPAIDQITTLQKYLNVVVQALGPDLAPVKKLKPNGQLNSATKEHIRLFYNNFAEPLQLERVSPDNLQSLTMRHQLFTDLAYTYSKITLHGLKAAINRGPG